MSKLVVSLLKTGKVECNLPKDVAEVLFDSFVEKLHECDRNLRNAEPEIFGIKKRDCQVKVEYENWKRPDVFSPFNSKGYKNFLYLTCSACGKPTGINLKKPVTRFKCSHCSSDMPLYNLVPLNYTCKSCGSSFNYKTNFTTRTVQIPCFRCNSINSCVWSDKDLAYITQEDED